MANNFRIAGIMALLAGAAWITWAVINTVTHGGLDAGPPAVSTALARAGRLSIAGFNLFLIPAALVLWSWLRPGQAMRAGLITVCGLAALCLWASAAVGAADARRPVEVTYLALSGIWWCGLGVILWPGRRFLAAFTLILGAFALWDSLLTALWPVPFSLYLTAAPKLPLSMMWDFLLGIALWRTARASRLAQPFTMTIPTRPSCRPTVSRATGSPALRRITPNGSWRRQRGRESLWLTEWLAEALELQAGDASARPRLRPGASSIFLHREFGVQVWAADLWFSAENIQRSVMPAPRTASSRSMRTPAPFRSRRVFRRDRLHRLVLYYGTDDLYLGYLARFVKPGGSSGSPGPGSRRRSTGRFPSISGSGGPPMSGAFIRRRGGAGTGKRRAS